MMEELGNVPKIFLLAPTQYGLHFMTHVIALLEKYNSFDYDEEFSMKHEEKWGKDMHYFLELEDGNFDWKSERDDELAEDKLKKSRMSI